MSAFILDQDHINAMLQAAAPRWPGDSANYRWNGEAYYFGANRQQVGQVLLNENYRSVNYRYGESEQPPTFVSRPVRSQTPVQLIKLCDCYNYQTCETPDWEQTEAYAICHALRERAIDKLPGYEDAAWTFGT